MKEMNLPNKLTVFRIFMVPLLVIVMNLNFSGKFLVSLIIFMIASITDALDGKIARDRNLITDFGKFMDPLADKLLVISVMVCMIEAGLISGWIVIIVVSRELAVSIMRAIIATDGVVLAAGFSGKLKTATQMLGIIFVLLGAHLGSGVALTIGNVLVYVSVALTIYSGYVYFRCNSQLFDDI